MCSLSQLRYPCRRYQFPHVHTGTESLPEENARQLRVNSRLSTCTYEACAQKEVRINCRRTRATRRRPHRESEPNRARPNYCLMCLPFQHRCDTQRPWLPRYIHLPLKCVHVCYRVLVASRVIHTSRTSTCMCVTGGPWLPRVTHTSRTSVYACVSPGTRGVSRYTSHDPMATFCTSVFTQEPHMRARSRPCRLVMRVVDTFNSSSRVCLNYMEAKLPSRHIVPEPVQMMPFTSS